MTPARRRAGIHFILPCGLPASHQHAAGVNCALEKESKVLVVFTPRPAQGCSPTPISQLLPGLHGEPTKYLDLATPYPALTEAG